MTAVAKIKGDDISRILDMSKEKQKYIKCWNVDGYRKISPGVNCVEMFLDAVEESAPDSKGGTLIDFGCGTGRAAKLLDEHFDVTPMDFAPNCLDEEVAEHFGGRFVEHDITKKTPLRAEWGYCTDVMEHLPPEEVDDALSTILEASENVFFQIANFHDHYGGHPDIQDHLHLTVWDYDQWLKKFNDHGVIIHRSMDFGKYVIFMVSGYRGFLFNRMKMNTPEDQVFKQVRENLGRGLQQLRPFEEQLNQKVVVLGGGPSLNDYVDEIKEHKKNGAKIITMNGSYGWAKEHDLWPVTQFMIDARKFNKRFMEPVSEDNVYILAAQVHPDIFDILPSDKTWIFNANLDEGCVQISEEILGEMYTDWFPLPGGSSVMLRALPALQMMGFRDVEVYGFDSCLMGHDLGDADVDIKNHHAFHQPENDFNDDRLAYVTINDKRFAVEPWMLCQANEYLNCSKILLKHMKIKIHGNGLIAHCVETGAERVEEK